MKSKYIIIIIAIVIAVTAAIYLLIHNNDKVNAILLTTDQKRQKLKDWSTQLSGDSESGKTLFNNVVDRLTQSEVNTLYEFIYSYILKGKDVPQDKKIFTEINDISNHYQIFT